MAGPIGWIEAFANQRGLRYEPDADRAAFYRPLFDLFERTGRALAPVSHELVALGRALMKSRAE